MYVKKGPWLDRKGGLSMGSQGKKKNQLWEIRAKRDSRISKHKKTREWNPAHVKKEGYLPAARK